MQDLIDHRRLHSPATTSTDPPMFSFHPTASRDQVSHAQHQHEQHVEQEDDDDDEKEKELKTYNPFFKAFHRDIHDHDDNVKEQLEYELSREVIDLQVLRTLSSRGLPEAAGLRPLTWKLLLGYLDVHHDSWEAELSVNRLKYAELKKDALLNPSKLAREDEMLVDGKANKLSDINGALKRHVVSDHPLSRSKDSVWCRFFQDSEITEQIDRDLQRTHPNIRFFHCDSSLGLKNHEAMRNILLLFAKLNPAVGYVQGMNEVLAPLFYEFSMDPNELNSSNAEADSFACFVRILSDSVDHFCQQLDHSPAGIHSTLSRLSNLLKLNDEELWVHLELSIKVKPQFYAFRWITLLLTQEFDFLSIMRIWDSLLSSPLGIQDMLLRVCCSMLLCARQKILNGDFIANMKLLQHYPQDMDLEYILQVAQDLKT